MTLGYASKAIDDLRKMRGRGYFSDDKFIDGLIDRMRGAVKFSLPENGEMITDAMNVSGDVLSVFKLPFQKILIEYDISIPSRMTDNSNDATRAITLATEVGDGRSFLRSLGVKSDIVDGDAFVMYSICYVPKLKSWAPSSGFVLVPYGQDGSSAPKGFNKMSGVFIPIAGMLSRLEIDHLGGLTAWQKKIAADYYVDSSAVLNVALCSMCSNVKHRIVKPSVVSNKIKVRSGKEPVHEYRILQIKRATNKAGLPCENSSRVSPKMHLRRGHIRRHPAGKFIWVNPAVVGSAESGFVSKSYAIGV